MTFACQACSEPQASPGPGTPGDPVAADVVVAWNARILEVAEDEDGFLTLKGVRSAALMHLAMHDALMSLEPRFRSFSSFDSNLPADPVVSASEAAYGVAVVQYPDRAGLFDEERGRWVAESTSDSALDANARIVGAEAAAAVLALRANDTWDTSPSYDWHPMGPGVYAEFNEHSGTPEGFVFGAGWAVATPFMLDAPSQFRSPPPPEIQSPEYTRAFDEVKAYGEATSAVRTPDQAHLAMWWKEFVEKSHNRLARELVDRRGTGLYEAARLFALLNMSVVDGYVASFDSKFHYNHWRPYTAIRWASNDGNPDTEEDASWTNLHDHTYAFPSYPSAHGTVCAAAMTVMGEVFGQQTPFEMTIPEVESAGPGSPLVSMDPPSRAFESFSQAAEECSASRVYLGIHFRYDSDAGTALGRNVGAMAVREFLVPVGDGER
ncbi:MAG: vanadium-dependent haloperoxidase [Gemmatimonadetes bacterium]|nr:vanadium-dependent haloperoxidase [Gemmatimonadota bacterium]